MAAPNLQALAQIMAMLQTGQNPEQIAMNMLQQRATGNNPVFKNLLNMAQSGNVAGLEQFARNLSKEKGIDFDTEFNAFRKNLGV